VIFSSPLNARNQAASGGFLTIGLVNRQLRRFPKVDVHPHQGANTNTDIA
jgi:hypothetical protein